MVGDSSREGLAVHVVAPRATDAPAEGLLPEEIARSLVVASEESPTIMYTNTAANLASALPHDLGVVTKRVKVRVLYFRAPLAAIGIATIIGKVSKNSGQLSR
jgi:hypothetical protein